MGRDGAGRGDCRSSCLQAVLGCGACCGGRRSAAHPRPARVAPLQQVASFPTAHRCVYYLPPLTAVQSVFRLEAGVAKFIDDADAIRL
eukprot:SAG31_NODE_121_length_23854_cov_16.182404_5_plen_88_part_00